MGLFSSKKKTTVGTQVVRVVDDKRVPDSVKTGIYDAIFNAYPIGDSVLNRLTQSYGTFAHKYYKYGKDKYVYGLPSGEYTFNDTGLDEVTEVLKTLHPNQTITVKRHHFGSRNYFIEGYLALFNHPSYNRNNNTITVTANGKSQTYYPVQASLNVPKALTGEFEPNQLKDYVEPFLTWDVTNVGQLANPSRFSMFTVSDPVARMAMRHNSLKTKEEDPTTIIFSFQHRVRNPDYSSSQRVMDSTYDVDPVIMETIPFTIPIDADEDEGSKSFIQVVYTIGSSTVPQIFSYELGEGIHPTLDILLTKGKSNTVVGEFFPFAYYRYNKTSQSGHESSQKLHKAIKLDFEDIVENVHENPDIKDVEQAMLYFGVAVDTTNQSELRYLFDFYTMQHRAIAVGEGKALINDGFLFGNIAPIKINDSTPRAATAARTFIIKDKRFSMTFDNRGIYKVIRAGKIGKVGSYSKAITGTYSMGASPFAFAQILEPSANVSMLRIRKQIATNFYEEIQVVDPTLQYHIWGKHFTLGSLVKDRENFLIPVDYSITKNMPLKDREAIYSRSMHFVFNSRIVTKVKWYQRGIFKVVMFIVAVVISIASMNPGALVAAISAATASTAAFLALIGSLLQQLLISVAVGFAIKLVAQKLGSKFAMIAAIVVAVVAIAGHFGNFNFNIPGLETISAKDLLMVSSNLVQGANADLAKKMKELQQGYEDFKSEAEQLIDKLTAAEDLLYTNNYLSPFTFLGESPQEFYSRTVESGNIGILAIEANNTFVDRKLRLPTFYETSKEFENFTI